MAVNVDDPSGLPLAQSFLASIGWRHPVLRDSSGQFFYEYNHSGQLPFSVLLDSKGQEIKSFQKLSHVEVQEIFALAQMTSEAAAGSSATKTSFGFHSEAVDYNGDNNVHNRMATLTGLAGMDSENWTGQVQYDFMYESLNNPDQNVRGDEIGYSYLEYHNQSSWGQSRVRLGDSHQAILAGELLSLQNIPNMTDPASLRGANAQWDSGNWSLVGFYGSIHPALFASPINPTTDLALPVPGERAQGASIFWHREEGSLKSQVNLDLVNYHRDVNLGLGFASEVNDQRQGAEVYQSWGKSGVQVRGAQFSTNTGIAGVDAEHPYIIDPYFWWGGMGNQVYTFHYIEYQSLPVRTLTPVLVENPALPLQAAKIRSFRFSPKFFNDAETVWFEPIWIFEEAFDLLPYERQNSYGFNLGFPKDDRKLLVFYQEGMLSPTLDYHEESLLGTTPVYGPLSTQVLLRHHDGNQVGDSDGFVLGWDISKTTALPFRGTLILSSQWTKQGGYYYGFSGISESDLFSGHLEWSQGLDTVRLGLGSEPGGIVCTNGVCVQKPPLNGADLEVAFSF